MRSRVIVLLPAGILCLLLLVFFLSRGGNDPRAPRFVPGAPASIPPFTWDHYNWDGEAPFEGGKMWVWTANRTNIHSYLLDLDKKVILGELFNGGTPVFWEPGASLALVEGHDTPGTSMKRKVFAWLAKVLGAKSLSRERTETFWILDLKNNSTTIVGKVSQTVGSGSSWHPSPNFRRGYTVPSGRTSAAFVLCDVNAKTFKNILATGELLGWWDNDQILIETKGNSFELFNVGTAKSSTLLSSEAVQAFLQQNGLRDESSTVPLSTRNGATAESGQLTALHVWNGHEYDFYFGWKKQIPGLSPGTSVLLRWDRTNSSLKVVERNFDFRWGGKFSAAGTKYMYQGESGVPGGGGNGAVYLREVGGTNTITVVPPDNGGQYAIPRFYKDEVIYFRKRILYRRKLDGTGEELLLPVPAGP